MKMLITPQKKSLACPRCFFKYYDTQFWVRHPEIMKERLELILQNKGLFTEPLIELLTDILRR